MLDALVSLPLKSSFSIVFGLAEVWRKLDFLYTSPSLFPFLCLCFLFTSRIYTSQGSSLIMHCSVHRVLFNNKWIYAHLYSSEKKKTYFIQRIIERERSTRAYIYIYTHMITSPATCTFKLLYQKSTLGTTTWELFRHLKALGGAGEAFGWSGAATRWSCTVVTWLVTHSETLWFCGDTVDGRHPAPVQVGSLSHYLQVFYTSQVVVWDFFH